VRQAADSKCRLGIATTLLWWLIFGTAASRACLMGNIVSLAAMRTLGQSELGGMLQDGVKGLAFPANGAEALAAYTLRLQRGSYLRAGLAEAGRDPARERFTIQRMADEMEARLDEIIE
jgi:hypothetical protein